MGVPSVSMRCPACGAELRIVLAPAPPTQWFPCPQCRAEVPVVVPREPPPLYSWEVLPGLYPPLPRPRAPRWHARRAAAGALIAVSALLIVFAGLLGAYALEAPNAGTFTVSGTVLAELSRGGTMPAVGAYVLLMAEGHRTASETIGTSGSFAFANVPTGGVTVNISLAGYAPVSVDGFVSTVYSAGVTGIAITLSPGSASNGSTLVASPFSDLESFLASIGAGVVLLALAGIVAGVAAWVTLRADRPAVGVIGGGAGLFAPLALYFLAIGTPFPLVLAGTGVAAAFGGFTLALRSVEMAQAGPAPDRD